MEDATRARILARMGIDRYVQRPERWPSAGAPDSAALSAAAAGVVPTLGAAETAPDAAARWATLAGEVRGCTACTLAAGRTQTVFGVGRRDARWFIVGEAPGAEEDRLGEPFVGRAGGLLDAMLASVELDRSKVYIANIVKCRPPGNRDPAPAEAAACLGYLRRQLALVQPQLVLALGRVAAHYLLETEVPVGKLRGQVHAVPGHACGVVVTYHPAYLLRSPTEKRKVWDDLCLARRVLAAAAAPAEAR